MQIEINNSARDLACLLKSLLTMKGKLQQFYRITTYWYWNSSTKVP